MTQFFDPRPVDGERYVGEAVELLSPAEFDRLDRPEDAEGCGRVEKDGTVVCWYRVAHRDHDGTFRFAYDHPDLGDAERDRRTAALDRLSTRTDRPDEAVERPFRRKHGYVEYLVREGRSDARDLFTFLADLRPDEAAMRREGRAGETRRRNSYTAIW